MKAQVKLMLLNVALAALAAFLGAITYAQTTGGEVELNMALLATAGYAALRAAIGLGSVYAQYLSTQMQEKVELPTTFTITSSNARDEDWTEQ